MTRLARAVAAPVGLLTGYTLGHAAGHLLATRRIRRITHTAAVLPRRTPGATRNNPQGDS